MSDETRWELLLGDSREVLPTLGENTLDACCCDPPYEIGFMSAQWDRTGIAYDPSFWQLVLRALKPGSFLCAFSGTRTAHRIACAIEDAGFEIRDTILSAGALAWVHGQGFPKRNDQLKPSFEPIICARKPLSERSIEANVERWGTGSLQTDAVRVSGGERPLRDGHVQTGATNWGNGTISGGSKAIGTTTAARHPPNVVLTHHPACVRRSWGQPSLLEGEYLKPNSHPGRVNVQNSKVRRQFGYRDAPEEWECAEGCAVRALAVQAGERTSGTRQGFYPRSNGAGLDLGIAGTTEDLEGSSGSAARFYPQFAYDAPDLWPWFYAAKAARGEREQGIDGVGQPPPFGGVRGDGLGRGISHTRQDRLVKNNHPTVKPLSLVSWLCRLTCPPGGTVLDPFLGSGTTACACLEAGFKFIGIEREEEYLRIAKARLQRQLPFLFEDGGESGE